MTTTPTTRPRKTAATKATATAGTTKTAKVTKRPKAAPAPGFERQDLGRAFRQITFALGPVTFAGGIHGAVADQSDPLVTLCTRDHAPTRIRRTDACPTCQNDDRDTFVKGQVVGDEITVLDPEAYAAIKEADAAHAKTMTIRMVTADAALMVPTGSMYYVSAKGAAGMPYALLAAIVRNRPDVAFLGELAFTGAPKLFRLEVAGEGVLALRELARPEALREQPVVDGVADPATLSFLEQLVDASTVAFDPAAFANPHLARVDELLKSTSPTATTSTVAAAGGNDDLLERLQASLAALKAPRRRAAA